MQKIIWHLKAGVNLPFAPREYQSLDNNEKGIDSLSHTPSIEQNIQSNENISVTPNTLDIKNKVQESVDTKIETKAVATNTDVLNNVSSVNALEQDNIKELRPIDADLFIDLSAKIEYIPNLIKFLQSKGLRVASFDDRFSYKDSDVILALKKSDGLKGKFCAITPDKAPLWTFLKEVFQGKI